MTYNDIYKKFLIEYDKADVSSSYPSLTNEEIAAILNKAMYALIAQKVTGNNPRKVALDMDSKAMSDIAPLIKTWILTRSTYEDNSLAKNELVYLYNTDSTIELPAYILGGKITYSNNQEETVQLLTSVIADKFKETAHNKPWLKEPVMYIQQTPATYVQKTPDETTETSDETTETPDKPTKAPEHPICIHILIGSNNIPTDDDDTTTNNNLYIRGIMMPTAFDNTFSDTKFPLSDTVCEELINLAVIFACRNVQDPRLATVVQTKSLEA